MLNKAVSILGCGWYGMALGKSLVEQGYEVKGSTTSAKKIDSLSEAGIKPYIVSITADYSEYDLKFFDCDVLIVSIPPKFRTGETEGFIPKMKNLVSAIAGAKIDKVIYISSTGVYGEHNNEVDEFSDPNPDTETGKVLLAAEQIFRQQADFKTTVIRFGGLIGPGRHPGRFFAGKKDIPNGLAPVNLIHLDDCIGITKAILEKDAMGYLINGCSPNHPTRSDFYTEAALDGNYDAPKFINELKNWKVVNSSVVEPVLSYIVDKTLLKKIKNHFK